MSGVGSSAGSTLVGEVDSTTEVEQTADGTEAPEDGSTGSDGQTEDSAAAGGTGGSDSDDRSDDEPSDGGWWDDRRRRAVAVAGAAVIAVLALVGLVAAVSAGGGSSDASSPSTTVDTTESVETSSAAETTASPTTASVTTVSPETTSSVESGGPDPSTSEIDPHGVADPAVAALLTELQQSYNDHDWDEVRRINVNHRDTTDEQFASGYGKSDGLPPRTERSNYRITSSEQTGESTWHVLGGIFAWRDLETGPLTLVGCTEWDVDLAAGTTTQIPLIGSDGKEYLEVADWVQADEFDTWIAARCADASSAGS
jgi:hypothetical protein